MHSKATQTNMLKEYNDRFRIGSHYIQCPIWWSPMRCVDSVMARPRDRAQMSTGIPSNLEQGDMQLVFIAWKGVIILSKFHKAMHEHKSRVQKKNRKAHK